MAQGNPNPSPETRFKPGVSPNPGGKTSEQRRLEVENAERATRLRNKMLTALEQSLSEGGNAAELVEAAVLKLLKDAEDRGFGAPTATVEHSGKDGGPIETKDMTPIDLARRIAFALAAGLEDTNGKSG